MKFGTRLLKYYKVTTNFYKSIISSQNDYFTHLICFGYCIVWKILFKFFPKISKCFNKINIIHILLHIIAGLLKYILRFPKHNPKTLMFCKLIKKTYNQYKFIYNSKLQFIFYSIINILIHNSYLIL